LYGAIALLEARAEVREAELARIADAAERVRRMRLAAVEEDLTLHCPRCRGAFLDFNGCAALYCRDDGPRKGCGISFCALCLKDCNGDAHAHVKAVHAPAALKADDNPAMYFFSPRDYAAAHKGLRLQALAARLRGLAREPRVQEALLRALAVADLAGVGVSEGELRAAAGMGAGGAAADEAGQWACARCTLVNAAGARRCDACNVERDVPHGGAAGGGAQVPPAAVDPRRPRTFFDISIVRRASCQRYCATTGPYFAPFSLTPITRTPSSYCRTGRPSRRPDHLYPLQRQDPQDC
jgi:hypothetical protein